MFFFPFLEVVGSLITLLSSWSLSSSFSSHSLNTSGSGSFGSIEKKINK